MDPRRPRGRRSPCSRGRSSSARASGPRLRASPPRSWTSPPATIRVATVSTAHSPDEGYTFGSQSMSDGATAVRQAAAEARAHLLEPRRRRARRGAGAARGPGRRDHRPGWELDQLLAAARRRTLRARGHGRCRTEVTRAVPARREAGGAPGRGRARHGHAAVRSGPAPAGDALRSRRAAAERGGGLRVGRRRAGARASGRRRGGLRRRLPRRRRRARGAGGRRRRGPARPRTLARVREPARRAPAARLVALPADAGLPRRRGQPGGRAGPADRDAGRRGADGVGDVHAPLPDARVDRPRSRGGALG